MSVPKPVGDINEEYFDRPRGTESSFECGVLRRMDSRYLASSSNNQRLSEQHNVDHLKNLFYLEKVVSYLMDQNKFFGCLQIELYLYFGAIMLFFVFVRTPSIADIRILNLSSALIPIGIVYIIFFIKHISKLANKIDVEATYIKLAAIVCYLVFIVFPADPVRSLPRREPRHREPHAVYRLSADIGGHLSDILPERTVRHQSSLR